VHVEVAECGLKDGCACRGSRVRSGERLWMFESGGGPLEVAKCGLEDGCACALYALSDWLVGRICGSHQANVHRQS
jgi:hypothetical protein